MLSAETSLILNIYLAFMVITDLTIIAQESITKEEENLLLGEILKNKNSDVVDELVFELNESISSQIDCTQCGNCCRV
jgi:hypothetical protein